MKEENKIGGNKPIVYKPNPDDWWNYFLQLNDPGKYPYTRGIHEKMYQGRLWTMRQFAGLGSAEETNRRFKYLLEQGETGLSTAFDMLTLMGRDSDDPDFWPEVGPCGVAVSTIDDMDILFKDIPLDKVSVSMTINGPAIVLFAMLLAVAKRRGIPFYRLEGTIQNDILKEYIAQREWLFPPEPSLRLITDIFKYCKDNVPKWNTISISGYHIREKGATAEQELAFTLRNGIEYVEAGTRAGLNVDDFAPRLSFFFDIHNDFFEEIAKLRAARRMWARLMKERFGAKDERSLKLRMHCQTAGCSLTMQQPENNIVRVALQALAAVLGGTQSLHTDSYDEVYCTPTEKAAKIALRTQQIIAYEPGVTETADPLAGAYFLEELTNKIERGAWKYIQEIDKRGGMTTAILEGYPQEEIEKAAREYQEKIDKQEIIIVGVNKFQSAEGVETERLKLDNKKLLKGRRRDLARFRKLRDGKIVDDCLRKLELAAQDGSVNLVPVILEMVENRATLGEICRSLEKVFGRYRESDLGNTDTFDSAHPKVFIAKLGLDGHDRGSKIVCKALREAGISVRYSGLHRSVKDVANEVEEYRPDFIGVSILVGSHKEYLRELVHILKKKKIKAPVFVGGIIPREDYRVLKKMGIEKIFLPGTPIKEVVNWAKDFKIKRK